MGLVTSRVKRNQNMLRRLLVEAEIIDQDGAKLALLMQSYKSLFMLIADISSGGPRKAYNLDLFNEEEIESLKRVSLKYMYILEKHKQDI